MDFNFVDVNSKQSEEDVGNDDDDHDHFNENDSMAVDPLSTDTVQPVIKGEYEELILKCEPIDYDNEDLEDVREESQSHDETSILPENAESESSIQSSVGSCLEMAGKNKLEGQTTSESHAATIEISPKLYKTNPATSVLLENQLCQVIPERLEPNAFRLVPNTDNGRKDLVNFSGPSSAAPVSTVLQSPSQLIKIGDNMFLVVRPIDTSQNNAQTSQTQGVNSNQQLNRNILGLLVTSGPQPTTTSSTPTSASNNLLTMQRSLTLSSNSDNGSNILLPKQSPKLDLGTKPLQLAIPSSTPESAIINNPGQRHSNILQKPKTSPAVISFQPISKLGLVGDNRTQSSVFNSTIKTTINNVVTQKSFVMSNSLSNTTSVQSPSGLNSVPNVPHQSFVITLPSSQIQQSGSLSKESVESPNSDFRFNRLLKKVPSMNSDEAEDCTLVQPTDEDSGYILPNVDLPSSIKVNKNSSPTLKQPVISFIASGSDAPMDLKNQQNYFLASTMLLDQTNDTNEVSINDITHSSTPNGKKTEGKGPSLKLTNQMSSVVSTMEHRNIFPTIGGNNTLQESSAKKANEPSNGSVQNGGSQTINISENPGKKLFFIDNKGKLNIGTRLDTEESSKSSLVQNDTGSNGKLDNVKKIIPEKATQSHTLQNLFGNNGISNFPMNINSEVLPQSLPQQSFTNNSLDTPNINAIDAILNCTMCHFKLPSKQKLKIHMLVYHEVPYLCDCGEKIKFYQAFTKHKCPFNDVKKAMLDSRLTKLKSMAEYWNNGASLESDVPLMNVAPQAVESNKDEKIVESHVSVGPCVVNANQDTAMPVNEERESSMIDDNQDIIVLESDDSVAASEIDEYPTMLEPEVIVDASEIDENPTMLEPEVIVDASEIDEYLTVLEPEVIVDDSSIDANHSSAIDASIDGLMTSVRGKKVVKQRIKNDENELTVSCPLCKQRVSDLETHIRDKHKFVCGVCDKQFNRKSNLMTHLAVHSDSRDFACKLCDKNYKSKAGLYIHERSHSIQRRPTCEYCSKTFLLATHLQTHILGHHADVARRYKCDDCDEEFVLRRLWMLHKNRHKLEGILCLVCGRRFITDEELKQHSSVHTKQDVIHDYCCDLCGRTFRELHFLTAHRNAHARRRYQCKHCSKRFSYDVHLQAHMLTHRTYTCKVCDKEFSKNIALKEHSKEHVKRTIKCSVCDQLFVTETAMRVHLSKVHSLKDKVFGCDICGKTFLTRCSMMTHKVTHAADHIPRFRRSSARNADGRNVETEPESSSVS